MVRIVRHRQPKGAANRYAGPDVTAPHLYSTHGQITPLDVAHQARPVPVQVAQCLTQWEPVQRQADRRILGCSGLTSKYNGFQSTQKL